MITGVTINPVPTQVGIGTANAVTVNIIEVIPSNGEGDLTWESSNPAKATVTASGDGRSATITGIAVTGTNEFVNISVKNSNGTVVGQITNLKVVELINKTTNYNGYYADINGDGNIDGIIYIDLLKQAGTSGTWNNDSDSKFKIPTGVTTSNVKDYVISSTGKVDNRYDSTARKVITLASEQTGTKERFYLMGLDDLSYSRYDTFYWYRNASRMTDYATTAPNTIYVGTGRANTAAMKNKCKSSSYGTVDNLDVWKNLPTTPKIDENDTEENRWFVPSRAEWCAFGKHLGFTSSSPTYLNKNMKAFYWTSTQYDERKIYRCFLQACYTDHSVYYYSQYAVRVSATF